MKKPIGMKRTAEIYLICNLVGWTLMTFADWIEETYNQHLPEDICILGLSIVLFLSYIIYQIFLGEIRETFGKKVVYKLMWLGIGTLFSIVIGYLALNNTWIVPQDQIGWEHFLNGIEYVVFGMLFVWANAIVWFLFDLFVLIYRKIISKSQ